MALERRETLSHLGFIAGEIEVFSKKGKHLGALDAVSGKLIKPAVRGRYIDV